MERDLFKEYIKQGEPSEKDKALAWSTAIGLQAVDGLYPSDYLIQTAKQNIEGQCTIEEVHQLLDTYYKEHPIVSQEDRTEEADKVSANIMSILSEHAFSFNANEYLAIHRRLFEGIYDHAGKIRDYNITKKEWVLDGATIQYGSAAQLRETLEYDLMLEKKHNYKGLTMDETIHHLAFFVARLWQIHIFAEGNTRTTAIFFIKYLRMLGFEVGNELFAEHSWYFRNCLVRANYTNVKEGVFETTEYLEEFLNVLLLNEKKEFRNRNLHVKMNIEEIKPYIEDEKPYIEEAKPYIDFADKTQNHIKVLLEVFGIDMIFGRSDVMRETGLQTTAASNLIRKMSDAGIIVAVQGQGKGKYRFQE